MTHEISPSPTIHDFDSATYAILERLSRRALRRHALAERERLIAEIVIDFSYALCRPAALIPRQDIFVDLTGITKGNVSTVILGLETARILHIIRAEGIYTFLPDSSTWRVRSRLRSDSHVALADRTEAWLRETAAIAAEQLHLLPPFPDLTLLLAAEARAEISHTGREHPAPHREPSTGAPNPGLPAVPRGADLTARIAESLGCPVPSAVPDSGTSSRQIGNLPLNALSVCYSTPLNADIKCTVPKSGTGSSASEESRLLADLAEACGPDAMRQWGGWWRLRIREHPAAVREAIGDLKLRRLNLHQKPVRNPGAWLRNRYQEMTRQP